MLKIGVVVIAFLENPICTNWIYGLKSLGYNIAVLGCRKSVPTQIEIENWGLEGSDIPIFHIWDTFSIDTQNKLESYLGGTPDILFSWEGALILKTLKMVKKIYTNAKVIHSVTTYPSAANELTEVRMNWRYKNANSLINRYIFYSNIQRETFVKNIPQAANKPYLVIIEPFLEKAFFLNGTKDDNVPQLKRFDENPHIIFTGQGRHLWRKYSFLGLKFSTLGRDSLGSFFKQLAEQGVHIFLPSQAETRNIPNFHLYPNFSNKDLFEGRLAQYISQFDAHLVMYNECNSTMRRWVSSCLCTRFAYSLTSTTPLAVTKTSRFVQEYWKDKPFGFTFSHVDELAASLRNKQMLSSLRQNMETAHKSYSFESQSWRIGQFFNEVLVDSRDLVISDR